MLFNWQCYAPRKQFADTVDRPVSYDAKHMAKVVFWIHVVQFARPDQAVQQRSPLTTMVRAEEQEVFTTQADRPQGIFSDVVVCFDLAIVRIVRQCRPLVKCVRERLCQICVLRQGLHLFTQPAFQGFQQRFRF